MTAADEISEVIPIPSEGRCAISQSQIFEAWLHLQKVAPSLSDEFLRGFDDGVDWMSRRASHYDAQRLGGSVGTVTIPALAAQSIRSPSGQCSPEEWGSIEQWFARNFPHWGGRRISEHLGSHRFPVSNQEWIAGFLKSVRQLWRAVEPKL